MAPSAHDDSAGDAVPPSSSSPMLSSVPPAPLVLGNGDGASATPDSAAGTHSFPPHEPDSEDEPAVVSPPYWQVSSPRHARATSVGSVASTVRAGIRLEDNTEENTPTTTTTATSTGSGHLSKSALWARVVRIPTHTLVAGTVKGVGDYVVWTCAVDTLDGGTIVLRKRYSEFVSLREQLAATFPRSARSLPHLPPKSVLRRFQPGFLEKRRKGLEFFLNCILLNPEFASSAILKEFVFR